MGVLSSTGIFIITSIAGFVSFSLLLRLFMEVSVVRVMHPVFDSIQKLTNPMIDFCRRSIFSASKTSLVVIALLVSIELVKCAFVYLLTHGQMPSVWVLLLISCFEGVSLFLNLCFYAILAHILLSWVPALNNSPIAAVIRMVVNPVLRPFYKWVPVGHSGFDFAPLLAILSIQLIENVFLSPMVSVFV